MTSSDLWDEETAASYDESSLFMFEPDVLDPAIDFLAELAGDGPALELAIGTGRVAVPLAERGVPVSGIELSQPMAERLLAKRDDIPVVVGDAAAAVRASERALEKGVFAQAIRPPTVPDGSSRLRLTVMASHTRSELREAARVLATSIAASRPDRAPDGEALGEAARGLRAGDRPASGRAIEPSRPRRPSPRIRCGP